MKKLTIIFLFLSNFIYASELSYSLSNQGFTGIINIPNAQVMTQGDLTFHLDNQFNNSLRGYDENKEHSYSENYVFGVGLFPYVEIQGRFSEVPGYHRDLSANLKFKIPYTHKYLPNVALGYQDLGSAANYYGNRYIVFDKEISFIRTSFGYGVSTVDNDANKRMDGFFGGVELKTFDWLYLLAENDSKENFMALRIEMPKTWNSNFKLNTLITTNITQNYKTSMSINLTFPLYENSKSYSANSVNKYKQDVYQLQQVKKSSYLNEEVKIDNILSQNITIKEIAKEIEKLGIENITIATKNDTIYIAYENSVFLYNDLDAMGIVIGLLTQTKYSKFILEQKKSKVVVITLSGDIDKAKKFYENPNAITKELFANSLQKISPFNRKDFYINVVNMNNSFLKTKIELSPKLTTFIGNEFGAFNYKLWLRTQVIINLYDGIDFSAVGDIHIHDSEIDDHQYDEFMKLYENGSYIESLMLHGSKNIFTGINTLSIGTFAENYAGVINQYINNIGNHTFKIKIGYFEQFQDGDAHKEFWLGKFDSRELYLMKYSYLLSSYNIIGEINFGKYWNQDKGFDIKIKRYFGDVAVYLGYQESKSKNNFFSEELDRYAGLGIEIPLTLKHTPTYKYAQIKGTNHFNYFLKSTILRDDGTNNLVPSSNYDPYISISSEEYFYNRNRLQLEYIKQNLYRLVDIEKKIEK